MAMDFTTIQRLEKARREAKLSPTVRLTGGRKKVAKLLKRLNSIKNIGGSEEVGQENSGLQQTRDQDDAINHAPDAGISFGREEEIAKFSPSRTSSVTTPGGMRTPLRKTMERAASHPSSAHDQNYQDLFSAIPPSSNLVTQTSNSTSMQCYAQNLPSAYATVTPAKMRTEPASSNTPMVRFQTPDYNLIPQSSYSVPMKSTGDYRTEEPSHVVPLTSISAPMQYYAQDSSAPSSVYNSAAKVRTEPISSNTPMVQFQNNIVRHDSVSYSTHSAVQNMARHSVPHSTQSVQNMARQSFNAEPLSTHSVSMKDTREYRNDAIGNNGSSTLVPFPSAVMSTSVVLSNQTPSQWGIGGNFTKEQQQPYNMDILSNKNLGYKKELFRNAPTYSNEDKASSQWGLRHNFPKQDQAYQGLKKVAIQNDPVLSKERTTPSQWGIGETPTKQQEQYQLNARNQKTFDVKKEQILKKPPSEKAADSFWAEIDAVHSVMPSGIAKPTMKASSGKYHEQQQHIQSKTIFSQLQSQPQLNSEQPHTESKQDGEYQQYVSIFRGPNQVNSSQNVVSTAKVHFNPEPATINMDQMHSTDYNMTNKAIVDESMSNNMISTNYVLSSAMLPERNISLPSPASFGLHRPMVMQEFQQQVTPVATNVTTLRQEETPLNQQINSEIPHTRLTMENAYNINVSHLNIGSGNDPSSLNVSPEGVSLPMVSPILANSERSSMAAPSSGKSGRKKINKWLKNTLATVAANVTGSGGEEVESTPTDPRDHHIPIPDLFDDEGDPCANEVTEEEEPMAHSKRKSRSPHKKSRRNNSDRTPSTEIVLRSCEIEPSKHQIQIPGADEFYMHTKICSVMENYSKVVHDFDFSSIVGLSRVALQSKFGPVRAITPGGSAMTQDPRRPIIASLLACSDDLVVEGFFHRRKTPTALSLEGTSISEASCETSTCGSLDGPLDSEIPSTNAGIDQEDGVQVAVFSSQNKRQFIVCFRGNDEQQNEPVKGKPKLKEVTGGVSMLHPSQPHAVSPIFRNAYFSHKLETKVFNLLNDLATKNPFCEVVCTGHSFGASLATICATRYAAMYPMMVVSCHAFGSPRVGGIDFRRFVNSLPNLKVIRIEHGKDPFVFMPYGAKWMHVGHTITINPHAENSGKPGGISGVMSQGANNTSQRSLGGGGSPGCATATKGSLVLAYRFDEKREQSNFWIGQGSGAISKMIYGDQDRQIIEYVHSLEKFTHMGLTWVSKFVGEEGEGVRSGTGDEMRTVV